MPCDVLKYCVLGPLGRCERGAQRAGNKSSEQLTRGVVDLLAAGGPAPAPAPRPACVSANYTNTKRTCPLSIRPSCRLPLARRPPPRGDLLSFLGCSLEPPAFARAIKCHQKSTSNSAGSSVGSLAPPRATPRLGGVYVSCQYFPLPLLLCTRPARARPSVGGQSPTPAPRQLPWSPPRAWRSGRLAYSNFEQLAHKDSCL
jgi:hypothetical protein